MASVPQLLVDIGQKSVKALLISGGKKRVTVRQAIRIPLEMAGNAPAEDLQIKTANVLKDVVSQVGGKSKRAIIALQGRHAFSRPVNVPMIRGRQLERIIRYEARQQIPFPIDQVNLDYHIHPAGKSNTDLSITILAVRKEISQETVKAIKAAGAKADYLDVGPAALFNAYRATVKPDPDEVTAIVNIGASGTDIVIEQEGELRFMRSAPIGGNTLTGLLVKQLGVDWDYAELLKTKPADQYGAKESERNLAPEDVAAVLERGFEQIVTEIRRSLDFYVSQTDASSVTRILLAGGTCKMEGVVEFLEERLGVSVIQPDYTQMEGLDWKAGNREAFALDAVLLGLAARFINGGMLQFNVAPASTLQRLDFERRLPLLSAAATILALILGGSYFLSREALAKMIDAKNQIEIIVNPGGADLRTDVTELTTLKDELSRLNDRFMKLEQVEDKRGERTQYYIELANIVPHDVWLSSVEALSDRFLIDGKTVSDERMTQFLDSIRLSPYFDDSQVFLKESGTEEGSITFKIEILGFRNPTPEEQKFVETLLSMASEVEGFEILKVYVDRGEDGTQEPLAVVGVIQFKDNNSAVMGVKNIYSAMQKSNLADCKKIQLREFDRLRDEQKRREIEVDRIVEYQGGSLNEEEFINSWAELEVPPTPTPTPTPTPEGAEAAAGMMGMYGFGMYGMGMGLGMPPAGGEAAVEGGEG